MSILPGPGDQATWPGHAGHANDPRNHGDPCPDCDAALDDPLDGCTCGWEPPEPDYEGIWEEIR